MGGCLSRRSADLPTAKLVVIEEEAGGLIREFPEHVKVAEILRENPGFFVCHADSMRYDEYISPLSADQELQVEHLYFLLPLATLRHPLAASHMAALAVKASAAMELSRRGRRRKIMSNMTMMEEEVGDIQRQTDHVLIYSSSRRGESKAEGYVHYKLLCVASTGRKRVSGVPSRKKLSAIHEEDDIG